jgi:hypothetical protein
MKGIPLWRGGELGGGELAACVIVIALFFSASAGAQQLVTTYDQRGLVTLSYNGVYLVNLNAGLGDPFQVWGYDLGGNAGFGGSFSSWDSSSNTLIWSGNWGGSVTCQFSTPAGTNNLVVTITITNNSGQTLNGVNIYPLGLQFPQLPNGFGAPNYPQFHNKLDAPGLIPADYGSGMTVLADSDANPLYLGFSPSGPANHYNLVVGTLNDSTFGFLGSSVPVNRPIPRSGTDTYTFSLRFAPSGTDYHAIAGNVLTTFAQTWPQTLYRPDRRPIGELFMTNPASSWIPDSSPNPRNYNVAPNIDIQTPGGLAAFQQAVLAYAQNSIQVMQNVGAQGAIVWDLEGQQFPQDGGAGANFCGGVPGELSYVGSPDMLAQVSPEMDSIADAFFKMFTNAGLKCGMTLRPQTVVLAGSQSYQNWCTLQNASTAMNVLIQKAQYAYNRWGCNIFYVDSDGGPLNSLSSEAWAAINQALPNFLMIPENIWFKDYAYTAPLASYTATYKPLHTPADARTIWPGAATVTYIGDAPNHDLTNNPNDPNQWNEFVQAVSAGDILSFRGWFDDEPLNSQVAHIYQQANISSPPVINSLTATPSSITSGGSATLAWNVSGATTLSIDNGVGTVTGSSVNVTPLATATYTLTAANGSSAVKATATVRVTASAPHCYQQDYDLHADGLQWRWFGERYANGEGDLDYLCHGHE